MPCVHKFYEELNLQGIDYTPQTLFVGTFCPELGVGNPAQWFFGNNDYFWNVLPRLYGSPALLHAGPDAWRQFCRDHKIAITDLISSIDDADPANKEHYKILAGFSDKAIAYHFDDFTFVNIVQLLQQHPSIKNVYLTRGITEAFWRHAWNPVMQYCAKHGLRERRLLAPTAEATYQCEMYNKEHPESVLTLEDYFLMKWHEVIGEFPRF